jgi:hypothetical protein
LLLDFDVLARMERDFKHSIEGAKRVIDKKQIEYRMSGKELEWH